MAAINSHTSANAPTSKRAERDIAASPKNHRFKYR
jgi:hypothetical protein